MSDGESEETALGAKGRNIIREKDACLDLHSGFGRTREQYWTKHLLVRNSSEQLRKYYQGPLQSRTSGSQA